MTDVAAWLHGLGLGRYEAAFRDNDIRADVLPELTAEDLREIGVATVGDRRRLLAAIAALRGPAPSSHHPADEPPPTAQAAPTATAAPGDAGAGQGAEGHGAERRQLTVLFCDLAGSTALSARLDPEDLREVMAAYHRAVTEAVRKQGGHVAKYLGDGVLAYFGWPEAHEDDAERAVRAGMAACAAVADLVTAAGPTAARVGIATGPVVVGEVLGEGEARERGVVGETPNLAARLQAMAEPSSVVVAASTRRLLGSLFEVRDLGAVQAKGFAAPVQAWQVFGDSGVESRFEAFRSAALTPLVGREEELDLLLRRWRRAKSMDGQVVLLSAEPGVGKSRLVAALQERLQDGPHSELRHFCSPQHQDRALHPIISQLERAAGFGRDDAPGVKLDKLDALLRTVPTPPEDVPLLAELLSLPTDRYPAAPLSPQLKRQRTLAALIRQVEGLSRRSPALMIFEDTHWTDPTSLELLHLTVARVETLPVLLVVTFRPEFQPPWVGQPHVTSLALGRLNRHDASALTERVAGSGALPTALVEEIVERTDGVPLFVEELTKALLEAGAGDREAHERTLSGISSAATDVPAPLHASLMARLDRLGPAAKETAQIGAAIGREFSYELLGAVAQRSEAELRGSLDQLVRAGLIFQRGTPPQSSYAFKHALVQDAAYGTLLRGRRRQLHAHVAAALEKHFPGAISLQPHLAAHHCAEAGLPEKAIRYHHEAGRQAVARSAMQEAIGQLKKALALLEKLAHGPGRDRLELGLQITLGTALAAAKGYAAREAGGALIRARELAVALDDTAQLIHILGGVSTHYLNRAQFQLAYGAGSDLLHLAEGQNHAVGQARAHNCMGVSLLARGKIAHAPAHFEKATTLYDPLALATTVPLFGQDPHVTARAYLPLNLALLGHLQQAREQRVRALEQARRLGHPVILAHTLALAARFMQVVGDGEGLAADTDGLFTLASEQSFALFRAVATAHRGALLARAAKPDEGIALLEQGIAAYRETDAVRELPFLLASLAEAHLGAGHREESLRLLDEALGLARETDGCWCEAELHRLKGTVLASDRGGREAEAKRCFE
ncbi:MAG TPA: adenylate/guanylate cyclase domain-containing protein, partial [Acetobacteraceae bacterium]|nr:adenylate/guanylate cyclase domain-containing protein [Acetobacteraceae bacterium]